MSVFTIPTRVDLLEYRQQVTLDGVLFNMLFKYNAREDFWYMDLRTSSDVPIKLGIKLLTGFSLLRLVADTTVRPAGGMTMVDTTDADQEAGLLTLGTAAALLYVEEADLPAGTR